MQFPEPREPDLTGPGIGPDCERGILLDQPGQGQCQPYFGAGA